MEAVEITKILKQGIQNFENKLEFKGVGEVVKVSDGVVIVYGLDDVGAGELVKFQSGVTGHGLKP